MASRQSGTTMPRGVVEGPAAIGGAPPPGVPLPSAAAPAEGAGAAPCCFDSSMPSSVPRVLKHLTRVEAPPLPPVTARGCTGQLSSEPRVMVVVVVGMASCHDSGGAHTVDADCSRLRRRSEGRSSLQTLLPA